MSRAIGGTSMSKQHNTKRAVRVTTGISTAAMVGAGALLVVQPAVSTPVAAPAVQLMSFGSPDYWWLENGSPRVGASITPTTNALAAAVGGINIRSIPVIGIFIG